MVHFKNHNSGRRGIATDEAINSTSLPEASYANEFMILLLLLTDWDSYGYISKW